VLFCNRDEARAWLAHHRPGEEPADPAGLARRLVAAGAAVVVLTDGPDGVTVADADGVHAVAAVPARPVDVTGAGDALVAGTLAGLLEGLAPGRAVARGTLVAALTVESGRTVRPDLAAALRAAREQGRGTP
jgi:pseudouridine kinase